MEKIAEVPTFDFHEINDLALDVEWKRHCDEMERYAKKLARAKKRHSLAKAAETVTEAEVALEVRTKAKGKVTDATVKAMVTLDIRVKRAVRAVIDARYAMDMYEAAVDTLEHRKKSLSDRISLWMADYFKEPAVKKHAKRRLEDTIKEDVRRRGSRD